ncbi:MAG TPA: hypothetical protein VK543_02975 [Puia sp.]|nr:hypothetical protein [Puia sp.]
MNDHEIFSKSEIESILVGEWKSPFEDIMYVFSNSPSGPKKDSLNLLVTNAKSGNYFLTTYNLVVENENILIEIGKEKLLVKYLINNAEGKIIHLKNAGENLLVLMKL